MVPRGLPAGAAGVQLVGVARRLACICGPGVVFGAPMPLAPLARARVVLMAGLVPQVAVATWFG